jgi:hypothetical protein
MLPSSLKTIIRSVMVLPESAYEKGSIQACYGNVIIAPISLLINAALAIGVIFCIYQNVDGRAVHPFIDPSEYFFIVKSEINLINL